MKQLILTLLAASLFSSSCFALSPHRTHRKFAPKKQVTAIEYSVIGAIIVSSVYSGLKPGHK